MAIPLNKKLTYSAGTGPKAWFQLNRWGPQIYTFAVSMNGSVTVDLEVTFQQLNRVGITAAAEDIFTLAGGGDITENTAINVDGMPMEFIRVNQTAGNGTTTLHVMQAGLDT